MPTHARRTRSLPAFLDKKSPSYGVAGVCALDSPGQQCRDLPAKERPNFVPGDIMKCSRQMFAGAGRKNDQLLNL
jgi:hypothetical protein